MTPMSSSERRGRQRSDDHGKRDVGRDLDHLAQRHLHAYEHEDDSEPDVQVAKAVDRVR